MDANLADELKKNLADPEFNIGEHIRQLGEELHAYQWFSRNPQAVVTLENLGWSLDRQLVAASQVQYSHVLNGQIWKAFLEHSDVVAKFCAAGWSLQDQTNFLTKIHGQSTHIAKAEATCQAYTYLVNHSEAIIALKNAGFEINEQMEKGDYVYLYGDRYRLSDRACLLENYQTAITLNEIGIKFDEQAENIKVHGKDYYASEEVQQLLDDASYVPSFAKAEEKRRGNADSGVGIVSSTPARDVRADVKKAREQQ